MFILDRLGIGGAELHTMQLASELTARGHKVSVVVLLSGGSPIFPAQDFRNTPHRLNGASIVSPRMLIGLGSFISRLKPSVVFAVNQSTLVAVTLLRMTGAQIPRLFSIFHTTVISNFFGQLRLVIYKWCTKKSDALIFVSRQQRAYWIARGLRSRQIVAIPNGVDTRRFNLPSPRVRKELRKRFGLAEDDTVILLVGRLAPEKNHSWLLSVLATMRDQGSEEVMRMRAIFIGEGPLRGNLEAQVRSLHLEDHVIFAGAHRDVASLLGMGDVGILVSHSIETFSLAALELMATGLPMIMTDTGGAAEMLHGNANEDEVGGLLVQVGDADALRAALLEMSRPARRAMLSAAARRRVVDKFTLDHMVDCYEAFLTAEVNE